METPRLIEASAKNFMFQTLQKCHNHRVTIYYYVLNFGILFLFIAITGLTLYFCNKQKLSEYDKNQKMLHDQHYVLSKIRYFQDENKNAQQSQMTGITNLPFMEG